MVAAAHDNSIKVFLDIISHGVVDESALIKQHPEYFEPKGSWNMHDYNW